MNEEARSSTEVYLTKLKTLLEEIRAQGPGALSATSSQYLTFTRESMRLALKYEQVQEVHSSPILSQLPGGTPPSVGIFYAHGRLVPCIDVSKSGRRDVSAAPYLIRMELGELTWGLLADAVLDIVTLSEARAARNSGSRALRGCFFAGGFLSDIRDVVFREVEVQGIVDYLSAG